eukprot:COSAG05_NODE_698_length_7869_cov_639.155727_3_plen_55_part_00
MDAVTGMGNGRMAVLLYNKPIYLYLYLKAAIGIVHEGLLVSIYMCQCVEHLLKT